ncbi:MAG: hypothetical protein PHF86_06575 [Candidatus Nanoarchaeia archaeon]|jgi:hypothetical protein|nr:hypothetical protein [Candidatus Nanoarchaeia archaeon]
MLREDIIFFLKLNPNPKDADLHAWAEAQDYDVHEVEAEIYKLATKFVTFLTSGRANEKGISEEDVDQNELKMGIEVEKEHTPDEDVTKRIALDHLAESDGELYYTLLKQMEEKIKKSKNESSKK